MTLIHLHLGEFSLGRHARLKSRKAIAALFSEGDSSYHFPIRIKFRRLNSDEPGVKCAFVVPKRNFRRAVDRNRIKRQMREAYRLQQQILTHKLNDGQTYEILWIYIAKEKLEYKSIEKATRRILIRLVKEHNQTDAS